MNLEQKKLHFNGKSANSIVFVSVLCTLFSGCFSNGRTLTFPSSEIRILIESEPASMNPRQSLDAIGQRLENLVFRGLTTLDANLEPMPDLSEKWRLEMGGHRVRFTVRKNLRDHGGGAITPDLLQQCFQNTFFKKPESPYASSFPLLKSISLEKRDLLFELSAPDPYLLRNLSVIRYFTTKERPNEPCTDPKPGEQVQTNGLYSVDPYPERFDREILLKSHRASAPNLRFIYVRDETSRLLKLMNGEGDVVLNSFSPNKTNWITDREAKGFRLVERVGTNVSYLGFNLRDPVLKQLKVREAIAHAINRDTITKYKLREQAAPASSFLLTGLPEAAPLRAFSFDPALSEKLLDEAGYPRNKEGVRIRLKHKTTTSKEGLELSQIFREMLRKVGIEIVLEPVEPAVFYATIRKGHYQMHMGRWIGVSDGSIFHRTLHSQSRDNRAGYQNAVVDRLTEAALLEIDPKKRKTLLVQIQDQMLLDLPYFPLWHWTNAMVIRDTLELPPSDSLSLSGGYLPLSELRFRKDLTHKTR